jgi:hypothetical protein
MNGQAVGAFALKPSAMVGGNDSNAGDEQVVCIQNIGPAERRKRLMFGVVTMVAGLAIGSLLILAGASHWWRLMLFLPFAGGAIGFFQAREKT